MKILTFYFKKNKILTFRAMSLFYWYYRIKYYTKIKIFKIKFKKSCEKIWKMKNMLYLCNMF